VQSELEKLNLKTLTVPHLTLEDIHASIQKIGEACGKKTAAARLLNALEERFRTVRKAMEGRPVPRVLLCIGRDTDSGRLGQISIAGGNDFYDAILEAAGGRNVYSNDAVSYPQISVESIIGLNPDIIVDLISRIRPGGKTVTEIERQWGQIPSLRAVQKGRVHVITGNQSLRPGPRYIEFLEELAQVLHPESFAKVSLNE
jgi:iron complex transport system substrate-binding protein